MPDRHGHLTITVAALTRGRPVMLDQLLVSLGRMRLPTGTTVTCLVVENDDTPHTRATVERRAPLPNGAALTYVLEAEPGIPFGRNRAAREAIAGGADLLAFVDDDEVVAEDWLDRFVAGYRASGAMLLGAPLGVLPSDEPTPWRRLMHRAVTARYARKAARAASRADLTGTPGVTIVTNNWLGETALFTHHGIWFDETMRHTGGTDAKFAADVKAAGLPTAWVADAHVFEEIPPGRLSLAYQFARGRDQSATHYHRRRPGLAQTLAAIAVKVVSVAALTLAAPFTKGRSLIDAARQAGWIAGRVTAMAGRRSRLYDKVTGR